MVGRTANGAGQQMSDAFLKNLVLGQTDRIEKPLGLQKLVEVRQGESGIPSEGAAHVPFPVALNGRFQNIAPAICAVHVAGAEGTPFQIAVPVEQEEGVVAGAAEVTLEPWNSSFSRRSKSSLRTPLFLTHRVSHINA